MVNNMSFPTTEINTKFKPDSSLNLEENNKRDLPLALERFLVRWDRQYHKSVKNFSLFDVASDFSWSSEKKQFFCKILYHARKHLHDFYPPTHENLYFYFTKDMGVSSSKEVVVPLYYLPFLKEFNQGHVNFLKNNSWESCLAAYVAYARLDTLDCGNFLRIAENLGASPKGLRFFKIRSETEYFIAAKGLLAKAWNLNQRGVKKAFDFIANHQIAMWGKLSEIMSNYPEGLHLPLYIA